MTPSQIELLTYLSTRNGVVPVHAEKEKDLLVLHRMNYAAINSNFARITDEGRAALQICPQESTEP